MGNNLLNGGGFGDQAVPSRRFLIEISTSFQWNILIFGFDAL
jgi:hypothetical protein